MLSVIGKELAEIPPAPTTPFPGEETGTMRGGALHPRTACLTQAKAQQPEFTPIATGPARRAEAVGGTRSSDATASRARTYPQHVPESPILVGGWRRMSSPGNRVGEWGAPPSDLGAQQRETWDMAAVTVLLLISGLALVLAELALPTHGVLATTGIAAVIAGILVTMLGAVGGIVGALILAVPVIAGLGALALLALKLALAADGQRARCGAEGLVGHVGVVRRPLDPTGHVAIDGEIWRARRSWACEDEAPEAGDPVIVDRVDGLTLSVRPAEVWEVNP